MWLQDSIRLASNLPEEQGRSLPNGSSMDTLRWISPMWTSAVSIHSKSTNAIYTNAPEKPWDCFTPCTGLFFNRKPAGVSDVPCFMTVSKMQAHVLEKWPDGNGLTGLPRKAWNHVTSTLTADRTGSKLLHQSTLLFGKMSDFLTCLHLENSWSRAGTPKK